MNKIVNINLGGYPFSIDEDAYGHLSNYLQTIDQHFHASEGYEEITTDIENRLAELFQEQLAGRPIVTKEDVKAAIAIMGTPEEFGAEPMQEQPKGRSFKTGKRLFRSSEEQVLGGVCSGLAAYFGIKDPVWVRLILAILALSSFGFLIPAYIIAWILLPEALTASDRLSMRGEPINVSNIGKIVEEELNQISGRLSGIGNQINYKEGAAATGNAIRDGLTQVFAFIGKAVQVLVNIIKQIGKPFIFLFILFFGLIFIAIWIAGIFAAFQLAPLGAFIQPNQNWLTGIGLINLFLLVSIPVLGFVLFFVRLLTGFRLNGYAQAGLGIFWTANLISFIAIAGSTLSNFQTESSVTQTLGFPQTADTLYVKSLGKNPFNARSIKFSPLDEHLILEDNQLLCDQIYIVGIEKSNTKEVQVEQAIISRGKTMKQAEETIQMVDFKIDKQNNILFLPTYYSLNRGEKFRGQSIQLKILVPESMYLQLDEAIMEKTTGQIKLSNGEWFDYQPGRLLKMEANGLVCVDCEVENGDVVPEQPEGATNQDSLLITEQ